MDSFLKIATININGLKSAEKRKKLFSLCKTNNLDVICFQEMAFSSCEFLSSEYNLITNISPQVNGVGMAIKIGINFNNVLKDGEGRIIKC